MKFYQLVARSQKSVNKVGVKNFQLISMWVCHKEIGRKFGSPTLIKGGYSDCLLYLPIVSVWMMKF